MYSDLFDHLGGGGGGGGRHRNAGGGNNNNDGGNSNGDDEPAPYVRFKAGRIRMTSVEEPTSVTPRYRCEADTSRGEVRLLWKNSSLLWQWYDRREQKVMEVHNVSNDFETGSTLERATVSTGIGGVDINPNVHKDDRIYVWTRRPVASGGAGSSSNKPDRQFDMYWMQDASPEEDDEIVAQVNQCLADPSVAAPEGSGDGDAMDITSNRGGTMTEASAMSSGGVAGAGAGRGMVDANQSQVDALSTILENLGMPQSGDGDSGTGPSTSSRGGTAATNTASGATGGGTITLSDLQGAMASLQAAAVASAAASAAGPALSDVVTPDAVTSIMQNEDARRRLVELLPEGQRTEEFLEENLRSPQVQQTLRTLTMALLPDPASATTSEDDALSGFYSIIANFSLDPADGQEALAANNPVQAFLDCLLRSVEKEAEKEGKKEQEEQKDGSDGGGGGDESKGS